MKDYFALHYTMAGRRFVDAGIHPAVGYVFSGLGFILLSEYAFYKTALAGYLLVLAAIALLIRMSDAKRTEFLVIAFKDSVYRKIRFAENLVVSLPFLLLLLVHGAFLESVILVAAVPLLSVYTLKTNFNFSIPTPFSKRPFEFSVGFRNTFYLFPLVYLLTGVAVSVDNLNLGLFALLLMFLIASTYYIKPENEYFVWSYSTSPARFLFQKLTTAAWYSLLMVIPVVATLMIWSPANAGFILLFLLAGFGFLWTMILAKYSVYPNEINIPEGILIAVCILFPPFMLVALPLFFKKSINELSLILK